jgi:2'-5' RNA ligase
MHVFLAVPLPDSMKQQISEWSEQIKKLLSFKKWILPADYHITVKFLGGIDEDALTKLKPLIRDIMYGQPIFSLQVQGLNTFGKGSSPRILWAEVRGELSPLHILQKRVDQATQRLGFVSENRPYTPHLTLAKNFSLHGAFDSNKLDQAITYKPSRLEWGVKELVLYQTHLGREPMYEALDIFSCDSIPRIALEQTTNNK